MKLRYAFESAQAHGRKKRRRLRVYANVAKTNFIAAAARKLVSKLSVSIVLLDLIRVHL